MLFLSQETLVSLNNHPIGHLFISVDCQGRRCFLGFLPNKPIDHIYWKRLLQNIIQNIDSLHIACVKNKELMRAILIKFPNIRICNSYTCKDWSIRDFIFNNTCLTDKNINELIATYSCQGAETNSLRNDNMTGHMFAVSEKP